MKNLLPVIFLYCAAFNAQNNDPTIALSDTAFLLSGKPLQLISGEMPYPGIGLFRDSRAYNYIPAKISSITNFFNWTMVII